MGSNTIKKSLLVLFLSFTFGAIIYSCGSDDEQVYAEVPEVSPVTLDMDADPFPYVKLSEYNFFEGEMKNLEPVYKVIPYDLNSSLFTDYAQKKRFIWMPAGVKATYTADGKVLEFPSGTVLIKNFYYDTMLPGNTTRIIETRLMIKKDMQWIFATYVWNDEQTEAFLDNNGEFKYISFTHNGNTTNTNYRVPSVSECGSCHKFGGQNIPIGVKPQNLNKLYAYEGGSKNQLQKLVEEGYLNASGLPQNILSTVDWTDASKPLELRVRSYLDINCAHCHSEGTSCDYTPMRLAFSESTTAVNLGVCVEPVDFVSGDQTHIVASGNVARSLMHFRMNTLQQSEMMPQLGRTTVDAEAVQLIEDWINAMETPCP
jgi:uncharacterized repeat protein (TIGR03806 family)